MFSEKERQIFQYELPNGEKRYADPIAVQYELDLCCGGSLYDVTTRALSNVDPDDAVLAARNLAYAACKAFHLGKPFDPLTGEGVLHSQWMTVLNAFTEWREKNELKAVGSETC